jgi:hypothetical protein
MVRLLASSLGKASRFAFHIVPCLSHSHGGMLEVVKCAVFQKELYNLESLYKFIQRTCTVFGTVMM